MKMLRDKGVASRRSCSSLPPPRGATAAGGRLCGGGSGAPSGHGSAADFVRRITTEFSRGQSGRLWDELLPADQRRRDPRALRRLPGNEGWDLKNIKVLETYDDPVDVGAKSLPSKAVTVRVTSDDGVTTATMHAVSVGGNWRWVLQPSDRNAYKSGKCPRTG